MTKTEDQMRELIDVYYNSPHMECSITRMAVIAPGLIAVEDTMNECDVHFDMDRWEFTYPDLWKMDTSTPGFTPGPLRRLMREKHRIGLLEGIGQLPHVRTIEAMVSMARTHLRPKAGFEPEWCDEPLLLEVA